MTSVTDDSNTTKRKAISYLVVGINTIEESKKLFKFLRLNGYKDVSLFSNFPEIKGTELPITTQDPKTETHPFSRILGFPSPLGKIAYQNSNDELLADQESTSNTPPEETKGTGFCCVLCGKIRPLLDARNSPKKLEQNIIFLSCLLMENAIDMETAKKLYEETFVTVRRLCQKHFIRAAAFIGREIKEMSGRFPIYGLHNVPKNILEVFLGHLQVFGDSLDEKVVLETYDVIRFFNDCLARYNSADDWGVDEMQTKPRNGRKRRGISLPTNVPEKAKNSTQGCVATASSSGYGQLPLYNEAKQEPSDFDGVLATDLLSHHSPESPSSSMSLDASTSVIKGVMLTADNEECEQKSKNGYFVQESSCFDTLRDSCTPPVSNPSSSVSDRSDGLSLAETRFRQRYRMTRNTFKLLCDALEPTLIAKWQTKTRKTSTAIRVATALEIMAGNNHIKEEEDPMNANVPEFFSDVLDALLEWSGNVIIWPAEGERERIHKSFFEKTGVDGIVGCVDGTVVDLADPADASNSNSPNTINVTLVTDDQMKIRWVLAKYCTNVDDNSVFKRSLLCEQLKDGTKQGILIGDDAYDDEPFLLTPSGQSDPVRADKLRETHLIAQATVESWKRQFPILFSYMRPSKAARIIVGSAALYNLTRLEGEPLFTAEEEKPKIFRRRKKDDQRKDKS